MIKKPKSHVQDGEKPINKDMTKFARKNYKEYGLAVLEDRAIPDYRDGMNPVNRRSLWSAHDMGIKSTSKLVKAARVVGDTMGRFHPHGDSSLYGAVVGMTNSNTVVPLVDGDGNWGSMSDGRAAAMRYTEMRLSKFSDQVIFNKFYLPVIDMAPNYDGSIMEPVLLPALLPIVLLNGRYGIAPGATTYIPSVTSTSLVRTLKAIYEGAAIEPKLLYKTMRFTSIYGGTEVKPETKEERVDRINVFRKTSGSTRLRSSTQWNEKTRTLTVTKFAMVSKMEKLLEKLQGLTINNIKVVAEARDDSTKHDKYGTVTIILKRGLLPKVEKATLAHIKEKILSSSEHYVLNFTERYTDELGMAHASMKPMSLTSMMTEWVTWRTALEKKACLYWIQQADKQIHRLDLLMLACDNLEIIFKSLKMKGTREELELWLSKQLKITVEDAKVIFDLRVYQLRALEKMQLQIQKKEVETTRSNLKTRHKNPEAYMAKQLDEFEFNL